MAAHIRIPVSTKAGESVNMHISLTSYGSDRLETVINMETGTGEDNIGNVKGKIFSVIRMSRFRPLSTIVKRLKARTH